MRLEGKIALISAAASGMGRAGARLFAAEGAKVVAADIDRAKVEAVAKEIRGAGGEATAV
ncbi:MAG TPA: SDR family NAD(P)-dependent oxidoreductase, partial [Alphaproteobacteria bacterium]